MTQPVPITVAYGDGIGPEIMSAVLQILEAAKANIKPEIIEVGEKVYLQGNTSGIPDEAWESIKRTDVFLKSPISTPQGGGYKSLNVTMRKTLGLFANVRPCISYYPFIESKSQQGMDVVIVRENEEDLYAGIEHQQTDEVVQSLKLISRPGCERIIRYAFEYALQYGRKKVTCFSKDNIMKQTDGLFHKIFDEIGAEYPTLEKEHWIIDIGAAKLAVTPEKFDIIVTSNLYGDIISDIAALVTGSVGLAGSANVGGQTAMFEAVHGSAPDIAGKGIANPSGLLLAAIQMLVHIKQYDTATLVHNAWLKTIEDGIHTGDIYREGTSKQRTNTEGFTKAVIERLGDAPKSLKKANYQSGNTQSTNYVVGQYTRKPASKKELVGVDVVLHWTGDSGETLAKLLSPHNGTLKLKTISNRGVKVYPDSQTESYCTDHWAVRYMNDNHTISHQNIIDLLQRLHNANFDVVKTENLYRFDGKNGFSLGQGE